MHTAFIDFLCNLLLAEREVTCETARVAVSLVRADTLLVVTLVSHTPYMYDVGLICIPTGGQRDRELTPPFKNDPTNQPL